MLCGDGRSMLVEARPTQWWDFICGLLLGCTGGRYCPPGTTASLAFSATLLFPLHWWQAKGLNVCAAVKQKLLLFGDEEAHQARRFKCFDIFPQQKIVALCHSTQPAHFGMLSSLPFSFHLVSNGRLQCLPCR